MTDQTALIHIDSVHKFFGDLHVLRGINLDIANGEVCVIMGPLDQVNRLCFVA